MVSGFRLRLVEGLGKECLGLKLMDQAGTPTDWLDISSFQALSLNPY